MAIKNQLNKQQASLVDSLALAGEVKALLPHRCALAGVVFALAVVLTALLPERCALAGVLTALLPDRCTQASVVFALACVVTALLPVCHALAGVVIGQMKVVKPIAYAVLKLKLVVREPFLLVKMVKDWVRDLA